MKEKTTCGFQRLISLLSRNLRDLRTSRSFVKDFLCLNGGVGGDNCVSTEKSLQTTQGSQAAGKAVSPGQQVALSSLCGYSSYCLQCAPLWVPSFW